jgi:hypothetical protein
MYTRSMWDQLQIWEKFISLLASYLSLYAFHTYPLCFSLNHIVVHSELLAFFSVIDWWMSSCSLLERFNTMHTRCIWDQYMGLGHFCFLYTFSLFFFRGRSALMLRIEIVKKLLKQNTSKSIWLHRRNEFLFSCTSSVWLQLENLMHVMMNRSF